MTPEHFHVAINHISFIGAGIAVIPLLYGLITANRHVVFVGLLIATLTTWTTPLTFQSGKAAYAKYEEGPIKTFLDKDAEKYLEIHEERAEIGVIPIYSAAILSTLLLILLIFLPHFSRIFSLISIITCTLACASGIWIADSGGKIRRPDFRISQNQSLEIKTDSNLTNPKNEEKEEESEGKEHE